MLLCALGRGQTNHQLQDRKNKATPPNPFHIVPLPDDQALKHKRAIRIQNTKAIQVRVGAVLTGLCGPCFKGYGPLATALRNGD